jgi:DNA-binding NarL/FixJ family response regulator
MRWQAKLRADRARRDRSSLPGCRVEGMCQRPPVDHKEQRPRLGLLPPFLFVTALSDRDNELRARRLGADDFIAKPIDFDILEMVVKARLAGVARTEIRPKLAELSDRETEVLTCAARGKTSAQIGEMLGLAKRTVDFHFDNARNKLGATTRTDAVIKAAFWRLIKP